MENLRNVKILYKYLSTSCKIHSAHTCLLYLRDKILTGFYSGFLTGMVLINLQKAFDPINYEILLSKKSVGFSALSIDWFEEYSNLF